jgi:hypothetical protein
VETELKLFTEEEMNFAYFVKIIPHKFISKELQFTLGDSYQYSMNFRSGVLISIELISKCLDFGSE